MFSLVSNADFRVAWVQSTVCNAFVCLHPQEEEQDRNEHCHKNHQSWRIRHKRNLGASSNLSCIVVGFTETFKACLSCFIVEKKRSWKVEVGNVVGVLTIDSAQFYSSSPEEFRATSQQMTIFAWLQSIANWRSVTTLQSLILIAPLPCRHPSWGITSS